MDLCMITENPRNQKYANIEAWAPDMQLGFDHAIA
jgi:hypothetical protein